jgi:histidyl-tRNA synthetase
MSDRIEPRTLKGFRDFLPDAMVAREHVIDVARETYRSYGFSPIDTPALEYAEILLGKGGDESDKQLYRFDDNGGRDVALRFDLTVPLARFVARHVGTLGTPFKRYHVGTVWRGENTQRGRYREFLQCDFDTIGTESILADIETVLVVHDLFAALGFERFTVRVNNRRLLNGVLEKMGLADRSVAVLRTLDKLPRIGRDAVIEELAAAAGASAAEAFDLVALASLRGGFDDVLAESAGLVAGSELGETGHQELAELTAGVRAAGVAEGRVVVDLSITRGLDYYTGTVLETFLDDLPGIGSVCSGGRYDDLASLYTTERLPGIGASLGVDRLLAAMEELGMGAPRAAAAEVLVVYFASSLQEVYLRLATDLRRAGLSVEVYPEPKKLGSQLRYADRRGHRLAVIVGPEEAAHDTAQVKQLASGATETVAVRELAATCRRLLA